MDRRTLATMLSAVIMMAVSCGRPGPVEVTDVRIDTVTPKGLRSVEVSLAVGVDNRGAAILLDSLSAVIKSDGRMLVTIEADPVIISKKSAGEYMVHLRGKLADGVGLMEVMAFVSGGADLGKMTAYLSSIVKLNKMRKRHAICRDVPLQTLVDGGDLLDYLELKK